MSQLMIVALISVLVNGRSDEQPSHSEMEM